MSIVGKLFGIADEIISSPTQMSRRLFEQKYGEPPSRLPQMFIGREGISNLGEAGVIEPQVANDLLVNAERDWFRLPAEEWMEKYPRQGVAFDPVANKAMLEISDKNVDLRKGVDLNKIPENEILSFDEVFKAETLKKAYPEIEDVTLSFIDDPVSSRLAAYAPQQNMILFNRQHPDWKNKDTPVKVALHEIQHYVQGKELFTQGESFTGVLNQNPVYTDAQAALGVLVAKSPQDSVAFAKEFKNLGFTSDEVSEAIAGLTKQDGLSARRSLEQAFRSKEKAEKFITRAEKYPRLSGAIEVKDISTAAYLKSVQDYMKVAGEVFARQTEQRRGMGGLERLEQPAMRAIETDPANMAAGVTIDNMTAPRADMLQQASVPADPFQMQVPQSTIPGI
jgi:hypothetical protein